MNIRLVPCPRIPALPGWVAPVIAGYGLFIAAGIGLEAWLRRTVETCVFHGLTGYPCPGCGSTRALLALVRGDLLQALRYNPLVSLVLLLGFVGILLRALTGFWFSIKPTRREQGAAIGLGILAIAANWLWVMRNLA